MTATTPIEIEFTDLSEFEDIEIPCDGPRVWPEKIPEHDAPARWVGVKPCGHSRLLCGGCKDFYQNLMAHMPAFTCADCGNKRQETQFMFFEPLGKM